MPHIIKLSELFNRIGDEKSKGLDQYWNQSSNPKNLRLAYNLYFMPSNQFRVASVFSELFRFGFQLPEELSICELGTGPGAGLAGMLSALKYETSFSPKNIKAALIEQDGKQLQFAEKYIQNYHSFLESSSELVINPFKRRIHLEMGLLPPKAPSFDVILMSYFLNEFDASMEETQRQLSKLMKNHLNENGVLILVEPALKKQSRKLLELRKSLLQAHAKDSHFKLLLPCLGHQACGALSREQDWCHEEVTWWRPPYFRIIDKKAGLDRKNTAL